MSNKLSTPTAVVIDWIDSSSKAGWYEASEAGDNLAVRSVGFVVAEDEHMIRISTSWSFGGECFVDPLTIPKCAITFKKEIDATVTRADVNGLCPKCALKLPKEVGHDCPMDRNDALFSKALGLP